jgi:hypothetical protein
MRDQNNCFLGKMTTDALVEYFFAHVGVKRAQWIVQ